MTYVGSMQFNSLEITGSASSKQGCTSSATRKFRRGFQHGQDNSGVSALVIQKNM